MQSKVSNIFIQFLSRIIILNVICNFVNYIYGLIVDFFFRQNFADSLADYYIGKYLVGYIIVLVIQLVCINKMYHKMFGRHVLEQSDWKRIKLLIIGWGIVAIIFGAAIIYINYIKGVAQINTSYLRAYNMVSSTSWTEMIQNKYSADIGVLKKACISGGVMQTAVEIVVTGYIYTLVSRRTKNTQVLS